MSDLLKVEIVWLLFIVLILAVVFSPFQRRKSKVAVRPSGMGDSAPPPVGSSRPLYYSWVRNENDDPGVWFNIGFGSDPDFVESLVRSQYKLPKFDIIVLPEGMKPWASSGDYCSDSWESAQ